MIKIYHNPRCRKSREGLQILENSGKEYEIVLYLKDIPTFDELSEIIEMLDISPMELIRKNEAIWKEKYKAKELSQTEVIQAMIDHPKLIERPIVIHGNKAVIGRPPENIQLIL